MFSEGERQLARKNGMCFIPSNAKTFSQTAVFCAAFSKFLLITMKTRMMFFIDWVCCFFKSQAESM